VPAAGSTSAAASDDAVGGAVPVAVAWLAALPVASGAPPASSELPATNTSHHITKHITSIDRNEITTTD
jgi:hypothetical protein